MRLLKNLLGLVLIFHLSAVSGKEKQNKRKSDPQSQDSDGWQGYEERFYRGADGILNIIRPRMPELFDEDHTHFSGTEKPKGKVTVKFLIAPDGQVTESRVVGDSFKDSVFAGKVAAFFKGMEYEAIDRNVIDTVTIPVDFPPKK